MDEIKISKYESAIKYFHNHIHQIEIQLNGIVSHEYRDYLTIKLNHYKLAMKLIERELSYENDK